MLTASAIGIIVATFSVMTYKTINFLYWSVRQDMTIERLGLTEESERGRIERIRILP